MTSKKQGLNMSTAPQQSVPTTRTRPAHILALPPWYLGICSLQFLLAIVILVLASIDISFISWNGDALSLFTSCFTIISILYIILSQTHSRLFTYYNYYAHLTLDTLLLIFWLASFAITGDDAANFWNYGGFDYGYYDGDYDGIDGFEERRIGLVGNAVRVLGVEKRGTGRGESLVLKGNAVGRSLEGSFFAKRDISLGGYRGINIAVTVLGAFEFVLFLITLILTSIYLTYHRSAGGHCVPPFTPATTNNHTAVSRSQRNASVASSTGQQRIQLRDQPIYGPASGSGFGSGSAVPVSNVYVDGNEGGDGFVREDTFGHGLGHGHGDLNGGVVGGGGEKSGGVIV